MNYGTTASTPRPSAKRHHRRTPTARLWGACSLSFILFGAVLWISLDGLFQGIPYRLNDRNPAGIIITMPDLIGRRFSADGMTDPSKVRIAVTYVYTPADSSDAPAPLTVIAQQPSPGAKRRLLPGSNPLTLHLTITLGEKRSTVPDVIGSSWQNAVITLRNSGFLISAESADHAPRHSLHTLPEDPIRPGTVLLTDPPAGEDVPSGSLIHLYMAGAAGPESAVCPDLVGRTAAEAQRLLDERNLRVGHLDTIITNEAAPGTVLAQNHIPGTWVPPGTAVSLTLAAAPVRDSEPDDTNPLSRFLSDFFRHPDSLR